jgi:hypothetical protein
VTANTIDIELARLGKERSENPSGSGVAGVPGRRPSARVGMATGYLHVAELDEMRAPGAVC